MTSKFPRDILVTTDFSESSYAAFPYALEYAKGSNSTLTLATVIGHPPLMVSFGTPHSQKEFDDLRIEAKLKATQKLKTLSLEFFGDIVTAPA